MFIPNKSCKIGGQVKLTRDVSIAKGTFTKGSILTILELPAPDDYRGEFLCIDKDSKEQVYLSIALGGYEYL